MWINSFFYYACCCFYMLTVVTVVIAVGYVVVLAVVVMSWVRVVDCWLVFKVCQSNFKFCLLAPSTEFIQPPSQTRYTRLLLLLRSLLALFFFYSRSTQHKAIAWINLTKHRAFYYLYFKFISFKLSVKNKKKFDCWKPTLTVFYI